MRVREFGAPGDPVIVLLHGGNVAGWMWAPQFEAFPGRRVLVPDLPGFGESNDETWVSIAATTDSVAAMLAERGFAEADVVGLSLGASVAVELAAGHPSLVRSLVLMSTSAAPASRRQRWLARVQLAFWSRPEYWSASARAWGLPAEDRELFVATGLGIRRETAERIVAEVVDGIERERLAQISVPTLALAGEKDAPTIARDSLELLADAVPDVVVATIPGAHHAVNLEAAELVNDAIRAWLAGDELPARIAVRK